MSLKQTKEGYWKNYYAANRERKKYEAREYHASMKKRVFDMLGLKCVRCGFDDIRTLQIDHVDGGGVADRAKMTVNYYKYILHNLLLGSVKYQVLCANCNWIKRSENKEVRK